MITKKHLKTRLKLLDISMGAFLEEMGYNKKHLTRYADDKEIPIVFEFALFLLEEKKAKEKVIEILNGHKKIVSLMKKSGKNKDIKSGDYCFFWNKNSDKLMVAQFEKKEADLFYPIGRVKKGYRFVEKFIGQIPTNFYIKFYSKKI